MAEENLIGISVFHLPEIFAVKVYQSGFKVQSGEWPFSVVDFLTRLGRSVVFVIVSITLSEFAPHFP